ncbi:hypothetical protein [Streptosporangium sp. NPDC003464]
MSDRMTADEREWARLDLDASRIRLAQAAGASEEDVAAIMSGHCVTEQGESD